MIQIDFILSNSGLNPKSVSNTIQLLNEGATIPFIARYRKEMTGGLDEVEIARIRDLAKKFDEISARQQSILNSIEEQGKLTFELKEKISTCFEATLLEDIYLPYKQKRLTKGEKAKKLGSEILFSGRNDLS
jgi:uncharacterized protein